MSSSPVFPSFAWLDEPLNNAKSTLPLTARQRQAAMLLAEGDTITSAGELLPSCRRFRGPALEVRLLRADCELFSLFANLKNQQLRGLRTAQVPQRAVDVHWRLVEKLARFVSLRRVRIDLILNLAFQ